VENGFDPIEISQNIPENKIFSRNCMYFEVELSRE